MLPVPVTFPKSGRRVVSPTIGALAVPTGARWRRLGLGLGGARSRRSRLTLLHDVLRAPARLTNFAVLVLLGTLLLSLMLNMSHYWLDPATRGGIELAEDAVGLPPSIAATFGRPTRLRLLDHLVIVPGHGIWTGSREEDVLDETRWILADYQRNRGRPATILEHIRRAVEIASRDPGALLVFSGGQTAPDATASEAESYARLARAASLLPPIPNPNPNANDDGSGPAPRSEVEATTEVYALDSFENVLFSLARFREYTGRLPRRVTVVGHAFKARRFERLHARAALRWPAESFAYVPVELATDDEAERARAAQGELENSYVPFTADLYGCRGPLLRKRRARNPHLRAHAYHVSAPELAPLLEWCPADGTAVFPGPLPWDDDRHGDDE